MDTKDKMLGCLYGQAVGNALGILTEFLNKTSVNNEYPGGLRKYENDKGIWEDDDTNQMLCILDELAENAKVEPLSLAKRFLHWLVTDGRGCGNLVYQVLTHRTFLTNPFKSASDRWELSFRNAAPNGALMRTSVLGLLPADVKENTELACRITHADPRCVGSCVIATEIIHNLVWKNKELTVDEIKAIGRQYDDRIDEWIDLAYNFSNIADLDLDEPGSIGYTLRTLAAALWCYFHADNFESGLISIVNEGGDADTNAAIGCAILGAKFGLQGIPAYYIDNLYNKALYDAKVQSLMKTLLPGQ